MKFHLTQKSENRKVGPIPVSTSPRQTCPATCPLHKGCYGNGGPLAIHWKKVTQGLRGKDWQSFLSDIRCIAPGTPWRHNQAGDLLCSLKSRRIHYTAIKELVEANRGKRGWTYTHHTLEGTAGEHNKKCIKYANDNGFTVNISTETLDEADKAVQLGIGPVCTTMPSNWSDKKTITPQGNKVILCPAIENDNVTCSTCKLCATQRKAIIAFPSHGAQKKHVDKYIGSRL